VRPGFLGCFLAVALSIGAARNSSAAEVVVIDSNVPSLALGEIVDGERSVSLARAASVTVITARGKSITRAGPYSGKLAEGGAGGKKDLLAALSALLAVGSGGSSLYVTRGAAAAGPDDPWQVDVTRSGDHCVPAASPIALWRPGSEKAGALWLKSIGSGEQLEITWAAGAPTLAWPAQPAPIDGAVYLARLQGWSTAARLVLHVVPAELPTEAHRAAWMAEHGCAEQAKALLRRLVP